ncbi:YceD family protein [Hydrogenophaga sp.]|uniref:YceD family protein n=1 Tax=Hydrogenophaga sp. TaxID=1904254 RepID=UPI00198FCB29|nr:YceD family protein [Hydrogenophaga sp.]MBD3893272.1 DUF177 domain-containing protein [Hydrogenophaga sp.]
MSYSSSPHPDKTPPNRPERLDVRTLAQAGVGLRGQEPLLRFDRLSEGFSAEAAALAAGVVDWQAHGELRPAATGGQAAVWLRLQVHAAVPLCCQRCLTPVSIELQVDRWFRFVPNEASAAAEDDACEEDLLALEPPLNLYELLEDELLLALPLVPLHDVCPAPLLPVADAAALTGPADGARKNPFAALAALKIEPH